MTAHAVWPAPRSAEQRWLDRVHELARRGRFQVEPNPRVGALLLDAGTPVAEGWHERFGGPHAEVCVFREADHRGVRGDTLIVSLEPCRSHGKTPPCVDAILARGDVRRVVVGSLDPDPRHAGEGLNDLARAGLEVALDPEGPAALERENFLFLRSLGRTRPHVVLKWAMTLDGRVAVANGDSQWITSEAARADVHRFRGSCDAVLTGIGTLLNDDCILTARGHGTPRRVVVDSEARTPVDARLLGEREGPVEIHVAQDAPAERVAALVEQGAQVYPHPRTTQHVDLDSVLHSLYERGVRRLLVEAGPQLNDAFLDGGLVDQVRTYVAPRWIGGRDSLGPIGGATRLSMERARDLCEVDWTPIGEPGEMLCRASIRTP